MKKNIKKKMNFALLGTVLLSPMLSIYNFENVSYAVDIVESNSYEVNQSALNFIYKYADKEKHSIWSEKNYGLDLKEDEQKELIEYVNNEILKGEKLTQLEKAEKIFKWVNKEVKYASGNNNPEINPYQVFKKRVAVCGGFSNLYKALLNAADIPSIIVYGGIPSGTFVDNNHLDAAHQWNAVYIDGEWFYSDSTWGGSYFKKDLKDFFVNHKITNISDVKYVDNNLTYGFEYGGITIVDVSYDLEEIFIPDKLDNEKVIGISSALPFNKDKVKKIVLGENVTEFEVAALDFRNLEYVEISDMNKKYKAKDGVLYNSDYTEIVYYPNNKQDSTFTLLKSVNKLDEKETLTNYNLEIIEVEEGNNYYSSYKGILLNKEKTAVITIPQKLEVVTIPGTVKLDNIAFSFKDNIKHIVLEEGITEIPNDIFTNNKSLISIEIPKTVTDIAANAFSLKDNNIIIKAASGSLAEKFASHHKLTFINNGEIKESKVPNTSPVLEDVLGEVIESKVPNYYPYVFDDNIYLEKKDSKFKIYTVGYEDVDF